MGAPSDSIRTHLFTCSLSQGLLKNTFPYLELEVAPWDKWYMHNPLFQSSQVTSIPLLSSEQKSSSLTKGQSTLRRCWSLLDADTLANLFLGALFNLTLKSPMLVRVATNFYSTSLSDNNVSVKLSSGISPSPAHISISHAIFDDISCPSMW